MKSRIVVIDDDVDDLEIIGQAFSELQADFECLFYSNPSEALIALEHDTELNPDYIFIDFNMGAMRGDKLLIQLRTLHKYKDTVIVINSTSMTGESSKKLIEAGATFTFQKPVDFTDYHNLLSGIVTGNYQMYQHLEPRSKAI